LRAGKGLVGRVVIQFVRACGFKTDRYGPQGLTEHDPLTLLDYHPLDHPLLDPPILDHRANIESSHFWDIYCIINEPYANMRQRVLVYPVTKAK